MHRTVTRQQGRRRQGGFTIVELLVAIAVTGLIIGAASVGLNFMNRQNTASATSLTSSNSAFQTGTRFSDDVSSVTPVSGVAQGDLVTSGTNGCGDAAAILRLVGSSTTGSVLVRSYHRVPTGSRAQLVRRECTGADLTAAITSAATSTIVVRDLDPATTSTDVRCDGGAVGANCRVLTMAVTTASGRTFSVRGSIAAALEPTPTTVPQLSVAPVVGTCTIPASATAWGATGGYAGGSGDNHNGDGSLYTYNDTNHRRSFLKFDLTQPCAGPSDSFPTLPGGREITGATLYLAYTGKTGSTRPTSDWACWAFGKWDMSVSKDEQVLEPLNDTPTWSETTLTGSNMPGGIRGGYSTTFSVSNQGSLTAHTGTAIVDAVKGWYAPGGWVNNGWRLSRSGVGDTCGNFNTFASRLNSNTALRPKLVITWGPPP